MITDIINELIKGFQSVCTFYFMGKMAGILFIAVLYILLMTLLASILGFLDEEKNK